MRTVEIEGPSFSGSATCLRLEPHGRSGIYATLPDGTTRPLSEARFGVSRWRYTTLSWQLDNGRYAMLPITEHFLGMVYALGLDAFVIHAAPFRLPHDGSARRYWNGVKPALKDSGEMTLWTPMHPICLSCGDKVLRLDPDDGSYEFAFNITVSYPDLGTHTLEGIVSETMWDELFTARSLWRSGFHQNVASMLRALHLWPHGKEMCVRMTMRDSVAVRQAALRELCYHRLVDFFGALMTACPQGGRFVGKLTSDPGIGHAADNLFLERVRRAMWAVA
ncbi:MAG: UDP-3-O-acyl-N-acetylglucosamine deacetylase [Patescibacteria group bacterium]|nr:UDP-3-O-acyl-N-acetylglucosamine deacetylase [Patescibacteria group bacterium]MDE1944005.1 UDP-3-O-acyl-N-acetylglucosamine deacetylase [Patescibacteria group bacterium]MDE1945151.1 UDP-3-O-acyl-N-acetylglucosamine deacetylase [Patescibacteria group bacterium]MDE2057787.1 UDP-3-O-acyl-N-acetylglucosamine deacetylase [Patescibacteria group bacterium]